jgi:CRISPR/Cas system CMR-associated protein Cmr1 (group 7 of RAMP superfamily)
MTYSFRVLSTQSSKVRMGLKTKDIINEIVTEAEKLILGEKDHAIFDVQAFGLKVIVQFASRTIHVMTEEEAKTSGLPCSQ